MDDPLTRNPEIKEQLMRGSCRSVYEYDKLNRVGEGTYGVVYRCWDAKSRQVVAVKRVRMEEETAGMPISSLRELQSLTRLDHCNVVKLLDVAVKCDDPNATFLVMEYVEQDLACLVDSMAVPYTEAEVKCILKQLLCGAAYMHSQFIAHRDLKMSNVLVSDRGVVKIADLGLARRFAAPSRDMSPRVVTLWYRAPELLFGLKAYDGAKVDAWACGCIFGELLRNRPLVQGSSELEQLRLIFDLLGTPSQTIWPELPSLPLAAQTAHFRRQPYNNLRTRFPKLASGGLALLHGFLTYDPAKRLSCAEALDAHAYFRTRPLPCLPELLPTFPDQRRLREHERELELQQRRQRQQGQVKADHHVNKRQMLSAIRPHLSREQQHLQRGSGNSK